MKKKLNTKQILNKIKRELEESPKMPFTDRSIVDVEYLIGLLGKLESAIED